MHLTDLPIDLLIEISRGINDEKSLYAFTSLLPHDERTLIRLSWVKEKHVNLHWLAKHGQAELLHHLYDDPKYITEHIEHAVLITLTSIVFRQLMTDRHFEIIVHLVARGLDMNTIFTECINGGRVENFVRLLEKYQIAEKDLEMHLFHILIHDRSAFCDALLARYPSTLDFVDIPSYHRLAYGCMSVIEKRNANHPILHI